MPELNHYSLVGILVLIGCLPYHILADIGLRCTIFLKGAISVLGLFPLQHRKRLGSQRSKLTAGDCHPLILSKGDLGISCSTTNDGSSSTAQNSLSCVCHPLAIIEPFFISSCTTIGEPEPGGDTFYLAGVFNIGSMPKEKMDGGKSKQDF